MKYSHFANYSVTSRTVSEKFSRNGRVHTALEFSPDPVVSDEHYAQLFRTRVDTQFDDDVNFYAAGAT